MRAMRDRVQDIVCAVAVLAVAVPAASQVTQQSSSASAGTLQLSSSSAAARAEFWAGFDAWQNFAHTIGQRHFERAVSLDPAFGLARVFGGGAASVRGEPLPTADIDQGVADAARASTAEGLLALAWREKTVHGELAAIPLLRFATEYMPNEPRFASEYVWSLSSKDMKAAVEFGRAAKAKFPDFAPLCPALSYVLAQTGDTVGALAEAERYAQLAPTQPASFVQSGDLLTALGRLDEAEVQYRKAIALSGHADFYAEGYLGLATVMELRGNSAGARELLANGVQRATTAPDSMGYLQALGGALLYAGDVPGALRAYASLARLSASLPNFGRYEPSAVMALTTIAFGDGRSLEAYLAPVHALVPNDTVIIENWFASIYAQAGQSDSALKYANRLLARASTNTFAGQVGHFALGQLYLTKHRCREALGEFRQSDTTVVEVQAGLAECEMQLGNRVAALQWRDRVRARRDVNFFDPGEIRARMQMAQLR